MSGYMQNKFAISDFADFTLSAHDTISGSVQSAISSTDNAVVRCLYCFRRFFDFNKCPGRIITEPFIPLYI